MPAIITTALRVANATNFLQYCQNPATNLYAFISRTLPWVSDSSPPTPVDCISESTAAYIEMMSLKKVSSNDVSLVIPRYNWTTGTTYTQYSNIINLYGSLAQPFYVVNSSLGVYKCISNNGNVPSTVQPTSTSTNVVQYGDGYQWKYMFTVSSGDAIKFTTSDYVPVKTLTSNDGSAQWLVQQAAVKGTVDRIDMTASGSGYTSTVNVQIDGDGTGAAATATVTSQSVTKVTVTNPGSGYTYANITLTGVGGAGAKANSVLSPLAGHGADPINELGAFTTMIQSALTTDESGVFTVTNDYRRVGLVSNPFLLGTTTPASALDYTMSTNLYVSGTSGTFVIDEKVTGTTSGATAYVLDWTPATGILRLVQVKGTFTPGETLSGGTSAATAQYQTISATAVSGTTSSITLPAGASAVDGFYNGQTLTITGGTGNGQVRTILNYTGASRIATVTANFTTAPASNSNFVISKSVAPQLQVSSGTILYLENRTPIMRASDQSEQIRFLVSQ